MQGRAGSEKISVCFDGPVNKLETHQRALTEESPTAREYHVPTSAHSHYEVCCCRLPSPREPLFGNGQGKKRIGGGTAPWQTRSIVGIGATGSSRRRRRNWRRNFHFWFVLLASALTQCFTFGLGFCVVLNLCSGGTLGSEGRRSTVW